MSGVVRLRGFGRAVVVGAVTGIIVYLLFLALAWASLGVQRGSITAPVRAAFAAGDLRPGATNIFGDIDIGVHQFNDCLILYQAIDDRAAPAARATSPLSAAIDVDNPCTLLRGLSDGAAQPAPTFYHHYLHAQTTLARYLVPALGVRGTREFYRLAISFALLAGIALTMAALARGGDRVRGGVWLILFAVFARGFGFESFGQSLGHAPADLLILLYLLFLSVGSAESPLGARAVIIGSAVFGALTMEFEMLSGGLPLGLAVTIGAVPFALPKDRDPLPTTARATVAFVTGALACAAGKVVALLSVFGSGPIVESVRQLLFRAGMNASSTRDGTAGWSDFHSHIWAGLQALAPGMHWLVAGLIAIAVGAGVWSYRRLRSSPDVATRSRAVALAGSNVVILLWMVVFWQHTTQHAWFMDRILVWPLASGAALFLLAIAAMPRTGDQASGPGTAR